MYCRKQPFVPAFWFVMYCSATVFSVCPLPHSRWVLLFCDTCLQTSPQASVYGWRVLDTAPAVLLLHSPDLQASGSRFAVFRFGVNGSYAGVAGITYSVLLTNDPFIGEWHTPDVCGGALPDAVSVTQRDCVSEVCSSAGCTYTVSLPVNKEYTLRLRTNFVASTVPELQVTWTHVRCDSSQFSVVSGNDTVTCHNCPAGGNCTLPLTTAFSESNPSGSQVLDAFIVRGPARQATHARPATWTLAWSRAQAAPPQAVQWAKLHGCPPCPLSESLWTHAWKAAPRDGHPQPYPATTCQRLTHPRRVVGTPSHFRTSWRRAGK
jgi:hypothetical protein